MTERDEPYTPSLDKQVFCNVRGDNGESTWSKGYTMFKCTHPVGHRGKHSWERKGRYLA